jgi:insertion element IS1 protein InsB
MTLNGSGIRDISRVLSVSINTVLKAIHLQADKVIEPVAQSRITDLQLDEMWSFVGSKENPCWLWYGFDPDKKKITCFQLGRRTDENCEKMLSKLKGSQVLRFCTDDWESYKKFLPETHH